MTDTDSILLLIKSIMGLLALLIILFFLLFLSLRSKKKTKKRIIKKKKQAKKDTSSLNYLRSIIKNSNSTTQELKEALDLILQNYGTISKNPNKKVKEDFDVYMDIIFRLCRHPNTTKELIVTFNTALEKRNPEFKKEITSTMLKGLNSRVR